MDWLTHLFVYQDKFLGIEWHFWKVVGWTGNIAFSSRFFVQWWATERQKRVVVPVVFWWLSLFGSGCLLAYSVYQRDSVFFFSYVFTWIPYIRNLIIGYRHTKAQLTCRSCETVCPPRARFCLECGARLAELTKPS